MSLNEFVRMKDQPDFFSCTRRLAVYVDFYSAGSIAAVASPYWPPLISVLRTLGGAQKNEFWLQMKADVTGLPVEVVSNPELTLLGAAILAGIGSGIYTDAGDALSRTEFRITVYEPDNNRHEEYNEWYEKVFAKIAPALEEIYRNV